MQLKLITAALNARCEEICAGFFGEPTQVNQFELRWGAKGSFALRRTGPKRGFWFDHEQGRGGDVLSLICREHGVGIRDAIEIAQRDYLGKQANINNIHVHNPNNDLPPEPFDESKRRAALCLFDEGRPL